VGHAVGRDRDAEQPVIVHPQRESVEQIRWIQTLVRSLRFGLDPVPDGPQFGVMSMKSASCSIYVKTVAA
jgi:hypothetical protein